MIQVEEAIATRIEHMLNIIIYPKIRDEAIIVFGEVLYFSHERTLSSNYTRNFIIEASLIIIKKELSSATFFRMIKIYD